MTTKTKTTATKAASAAKPSHKEAGAAIKAAYALYVEAGAASVDAQRKAGVMIVSVEADNPVRHGWIDDKGKALKGKALINARGKWYQDTLNVNAQFVSDARARGLAMYLLPATTEAGLSVEHIKRLAPTLRGKGTKAAKTKAAKAALATASKAAKADGRTMTGADISKATGAKGSKAGSAKRQPTVEAALKALASVDMTIKATLATELGSIKAADIKAAKAQLKRIERFVLNADKARLAATKTKTTKATRKTA